METKLMTIQQAAEYLNVSRETLYKYAQRGMIPAARIGRHWRFDQQTLSDWMKRQSVGLRAEAKPAVVPPVPEAPREGLDVLVVDDDPGVRRLLGAWIQADGHRVDEVGTGAEAMTQLTSRSYNLVFLDLNMPGLSGSQVLGRLQEYDDRPPVVLITGYGASPLIDQALNYDLLYVLSKPFSREQVRKLLHSVRATRSQPYGKPDARAASAHADAFSPFKK